MGRAALDCLRKRGSGFYRFRGFSGGAAHFVIPSVAEGSLWHHGQYYIGTDTETTPWCYVFLRSHIHRFPVYKKDFSLRSK